MNRIEPAAGVRPPLGGQRRFELQRGAVDVDEVGRQPLGDGGIGEAGSHHAVEARWVGCEAYNKVPAACAGQVIKLQVLTLDRKCGNEGKDTAGKAQVPESDPHGGSFIELAGAVKGFRRRFSKGLLLPVMCTERSVALRSISVL